MDNSTLGELPLEELWRLFPIEVVPYNPAWPVQYDAEKNVLQTLLGPALLRINHIGSTAVPGLDAKAIIDILVELEPGSDIDNVSAALLADGWLLMDNTREPELHMKFNKGYTWQGFVEPVYHLHVCHLGNHDELYFRDLLRNDPELCERYAALKHSLAEPYRNDRDGYTAQKGPFISAALKTAHQRYAAVITHF
jgi:GrpB-like predicted nucleotidyltransferase (UPF0157 family)